MERPDLGEAVLDGHAPLDADQRGDLAGLDNALDVSGGQGKLQIGRVFLDQPMDQVDLLGDRPRGVLMLAGNVDRPELGFHSAFAEPGNVRLAGVEPRHGCGDLLPALAGVHLGPDDLGLTADRSGRSRLRSVTVASLDPARCAGSSSGDDGQSLVPSFVLFMPASEVRRGPASPEEQVASEQVSSLPALWRPGPQALIPLQEVLRGAALAGRKQEPGLRGVWLVSTYESRPLSSGVTHETSEKTDQAVTSK